MSPLEVLGAELGAIAARIDRETTLRLDSALADLRRATAEMDLRFERLERAFADRVAGIKDGTSVTPADVAPMIEDAVRSAVASAAGTVREQMSVEIAEKVAALPKPKDGADAEPAAVAEALLPSIESMIAERVALIEVPAATFDHEALAAAARNAVSALPTPRDGNDADPVDIARALADIITPDVQEMISAEAAKMPPPMVDEEMIAQAVRRAVEALPPAEPGKDADMDVLRAFILEEVAKIPAPKDGQSPSAEDIQPLVDKAVGAAVAAIPTPKDGADADMEVVRQMVRDEVAAIPVPKDGEEPSSERIIELASPIIARLVSEIPPAAPGKDADPEDIRRMVEEAVSAIPPAKDGETPSPEAIRAVVEEVARAVIDEMPKPRDGEPGKSVDPDDVRAMVDEAVAAIPAPKDGKDGQLPIVRAWEDRVYYAGEVCSHDGATYQASVDTGRAPPHADWTCLAAKGRDGADADQIELCGTFDAEREYRKLSVVMLNGASFIARRDNPGQCPGEGWQLMAQQGKRGGPGPVTKADRGTRPIKMTVNDDGLLHLEMDDGTSVECDLYPLLSRL